MRVEYDPEIRSMDDSVEKFLAPMLAAPAKIAVGAAKLGANAIKAGAAKLGIGGKTGGVDPTLTAAQQKVSQAEQELQMAQQELQTLEGQAAQAPAQEPPAQAQPMPALATAGKAIGGLDGNDQEGSPTEQPGTNATAPPSATDPPIVSKTYFQDNFGIDGPDLIDLLEKGGEGELVPSVITLLRAEQQAVLKQFDWWDNDDWPIMKLQDNDYNLLIMYRDRLELPLRQTIVGVKKATGEAEKDEIWKGWHSRLDAENRLSRRERGILEECNNTLRKHGDMNSQTLSSYGVKASSSEIGSLIKGYGYLYDVTVVGKGTKDVDRTLYYGTPKPPIFLKKIDSFIGNLWEVDGSLELTPTGAPRLSLPFTTNRGLDYTVVLKKGLDVEGIMWEGDKFVIEGTTAFKKATSQALPFLIEKQPEAAIMLAALDGDERAERLVAYRHQEPQQQVNLLKEWNVSEGELKAWAEVIING
jgi:hypothetical protein